METSAYITHPLESKWKVQEMSYCFLVVSVYIQDSWWVFSIVAKREENYPLGWSDLIQETLSESSLGKGGRVEGSVCVLQGKNLTCLFHNEWIFCSSCFCLFSNPWNLRSLQHKQAINQQGFSCQDEGCGTFTGTVIPVCMSETRSGTHWHTCFLN